MAKEYIYWIPGVLICNNQNRPLSTMSFKNLEKAKIYASFLAKVNKETIFFKAEKGYKVYQIHPENS